MHNDNSIREHIEALKIKQKLIHDVKRQTEQTWQLLQRLKPVGDR